MDIDILRKIGFTDKAANIYLALLQLGPASVRQLAEKTDINRGTVHDMLKWLREKELVNFYEKDTKQYFVAENPDKLRELVEDESDRLRFAKDKLDDYIPELKSIYDKGGERPVARYFDKNDLHKILEDVLVVCEQNAEQCYRIYTVAGIREYLYDSFPTFSDVRVAKNIQVKAIAIGAGGELRGLDERKWLKEEVNTPTYIIIYPGHTAYISLDAKNEPVGVVIENDGVYEVQKQIFDSLWNKI